MAKAGKLSIDVEARVAKLESGLLKATKSIRRFESNSKRSFKRVGESMKKMIGPIIALASGAALISLAKRTADWADELGKMSDRLNVSTESIAAFQFEAQLTGTSISTVNNSLERMVKRLGEAVGGIGAAIPFLKSLNLEAKDLVKLKSDEAYLRIADAINKLDTQAEKAAATAGIFGREGIKMLNMIELGRKGFNDATASVERFGSALSRQDAQKIEDMNDAFLEAGSAILGLSAQILTSLAPSIQFLTEKFTNLTVGLKDVWNAVKAVAVALGGLAAVVVTAITEGFDEANKLLDTVISDFLTKPLGPETKSAAAEKGKQLGLKIFGSLADPEIARELEDLFKTADDLAIDRLHDVMQNRQFIIDQALDDEQISYSRFYELRKKNEQKFQNAVTEIKAKAGLKELNQTASILGSLSTLVGNNSKRQFKLSQSLARAETIVATYSAAQKAASNAGGGYAGAIAAGVEIFAGLARLAVINRTTFSSTSAGGGTTGGGGQGSFGGSESAQPFAGTENQNPTQTIIYITGNVMSKDFVESDVIPIIRDGVNNRDFILMDPNSRNAQDILSQVSNG